MSDKPFKLSASALSLYLKSPKAFYWRYIAKLEPALPSISSFDHDKLAGILWAEFVHRFYGGMGEQENYKTLLADWHEKTDGWVPEKIKAKLTEALKAWATTYYQLFSPDDGIRTKEQSELFVENKRFLGYLDGLSDNGIVHEVKSTSRGKQIASQLWKVQNSLQVKLYCVLAKASGIRIEFAYKDEPFAIYRSEVLPVEKTQVACWEKELNTLADRIYSLGTEPCAYPCNSDGCCIVSKGFVSMCSYAPLCEQLPGAEIAFKPKSHR